MNQACDTTYKTQMPFVNAGVRTNANGSIDVRDAARYEKTVQSALRNRLLAPSNAEGQPGHVSALDYKINRTNDVQATFEIKSTVAIRPLGYGKTISTDIGFSRLEEAA
jgi:hypothetical protein